MLLAFNLQGGQHPVQCRPGHRADADMTDPPCRDFGHVARGIVQLDPDALGTPGQRPAQHGHFDTATGPFMHRMADDPLDLGHQTGGGGLRDADGGCGLGQLAGLGQGGQQPQMADLEAFSQEAVRGAG